MTVLPVSTTPSSATTGVDIASSKLPATNAVDFLALLVNAGNQSDNTNASNSNFAVNNSGIDISSLVRKDAPPPEKQSDNTPAAQTDNSTPTAATVKSNTPPPVQRLLAQPVSTPAKQPVANTNHSARNSSSANSTANNSSDNSNNAQSGTDATASQPQDANSNATTTSVADASSADQTSNAPLSQKQLRSSLGDELSKLEQILSSVVQLLASSASAPGTVTPAATTPTSGSANTEIVIAAAASEVTTSSGAQFTLAVATEQLITPQDLTASQTDASALPATVNTDPLANTLLQDIQSLLAQLQQAMTGNTNPTPTAQAAPVSSVASSTSVPVSTAIIDSSTASTDPLPNNFLQDVLTKLTALVQQKPASLSTAAPASADSAAPSTVPADTTVATIQSTIADVRQQLQKLQTQNEAIFSQAITSAQSSGIYPKALFKDMLSANGLAIKDTITPAQISYSSIIASQAQSTVQAQAPITQNDAIFAAGISLVQQAASNSSTNSDSGNNSQSQPQAPAAISASAAAPSSAASVNGASFSKLLDQAAAPKPLLDQVAFQVKTAVTDGSSKINIQLHPADLGKLDIKLSVDADGKTSVVVTADNRHTLDLLQRDAQGLSRALGDAGLKTDSGSLSFNLGGGGQNQNSGQGNFAQSVTTYQQAQPEDEPDAHLSIISQSYVMNVAEGLDIQI